MKIMAIALGGCLTGKPSYGLTEDTGGHITYVLGAMRALADHKDVVSAEVITRRFRDDALGPIYARPKEILGPKLSITRIDSGNAAYLSKEALAKDRAAFTAALIAELRERDALPDIVHAHFADAAEVAAELRREFGIPFIYTAHSLGIDKAKSGADTESGLSERIAFERHAMSAADAIIGSSRDECERQIPAYGSAKLGRTHLVRPGIDQTPASPAEIEDGKKLIEPFLRDTAKPIILAIARPVRKKNLSALVKAFACENDLRTKANLVILPGLRQSIGTGEAEQVEVLQELAELIDRHNLYGSAAYPRKHTQAQVRGLYALAAQSCGVFANPALMEPFGLTILEAAAHGLPVVATRHGGPVNIIGELGHGILVDPQDSGAIASAISQILDDPDLWQQYSCSALKRIKAANWADYAESFCMIASEVLDQKISIQPQPLLQHLLICDIDNTLTGCRASAAKFAEYVRENETIAFGIATGRSLIEAQRMIREWGLPAPRVLITSVGSEIYWNTPDGLERDEGFSAVISRDWQPEKIDVCLRGTEDIVPQADIEQRAFKRSYRTNAAQAEVVKVALRKTGLPARVIFSHGSLLDVLPQSAGKNAAVEYVTRSIGIEPSRVIVAGDSGNDLDMIENGANAIIVSNAENALLALADRPHVLLTKKPYAAGVLEGLLTYLATPETSEVLREMEEAA